MKNWPVLVADSDGGKVEQGNVGEVGWGGDLVSQILLNHADQRLEGECKLENIFIIIFKQVLRLFYYGVTKHCITYILLTIKCFQIYKLVVPTVFKTYLTANYYIFKTETLFILGLKLICLPINITYCLFR